MHSMYVYIIYIYYIYILFVHTCIHIHSDIDECASGIDDCDPVPTILCVNHDGGYVCECNSGYVPIILDSTTYCAG